MDLAEKLVEYSNSDVYPMHMPGHKRNTAFFPQVNPFSVDITEIDGFDNLHNPTEIIKDELLAIQSIYNSDESVLCVNGSTGAILSAIYALTDDGDTIIMSRNCHMSVYRAAELRKLKVVYIYPPVDKLTGICGSISPDEVKRVLSENRNAKLLVLTSPTYEGVVSDVESIASIAHQQNVPLLVDEAHGAHFAFSEFFPESAVSLGADVTVQSFHKTLPCLTGTAVVHIKGNVVDRKAIKKAMDIFETSSPSYLMMASVSNFMNMPDNQRKSLFEAYTDRLRNFSNRCRTLKNLTVLCYGNDGETNHNDMFCFDMSKIVVITSGCDITAKQLYNKLLCEYKIQCEMTSLEYLICMTSVADTDEGFDRLFNALSLIDSETTVHNNKSIISILPKNQKRMSAAEAHKLKIIYSDINNCDGRVAGDYIYAYPPGIPLAVPGEIISTDFMSALSQYIENGVSVLNSNGEITDKLPVIDIDNH